jgi:hypothetical protein
LEETEGVQSEPQAGSQNAEIDNHNKPKANRTFIPLKRPSTTADPSGPRRSDQRPGRYRSE